MSLVDQNTPARANKPAIVDPVAGQKQLARWASLGGAVLTVLVAIAFFLDGRIIAHEKEASLTWPTTPGTITSCELREVRNKPRRLPYEIVRYTVDVTYSYTVDGEPYEGDRVALIDSLWSEGSAQARESKYQVGTTHPVYYNPDDPSRAVLEPGDTSEDRASFETVMGIALPLGLLAVAALLVVLFFVISRQIGTPGWAHQR